MSVYERFAQRSAKPSGGLLARMPDGGRRTGAVLALVLVSLLVASMLGLALLKTVLVHHRQTRVVGFQQQAFWLAEAGVRRAIRGLASSPGYEGETWEVSAQTLGGGRPAVVAIQVVKSEPGGERKILVEARLGQAPEANVCRREMIVGKE